MDFQNVSRTTTISGLFKNVSRTTTISRLFFFKKKKLPVRQQPCLDFDKYQQAKSHIWTFVPVGYHPYLEF